MSLWESGAYIALLKNSAGPLWKLHNSMGALWRLQNSVGQRLTHGALTHGALETSKCAPRNYGAFEVCPAELWSLQSAPCGVLEHFFKNHLFPKLFLNLFSYLVYPVALRYQGLNSSKHPARISALKLIMGALMVVQRLNPRVLWRSKHRDRLGEPV